jgi:hypothetical protein
MLAAKLLWKVDGRRLAAAIGADKVGGQKGCGPCVAPGSGGHPVLFALEVSPPVIEPLVLVAVLRPDRDELVAPLPPTKLENWSHGLDAS